MCRGVALRSKYGQLFIYYPVINEPPPQKRASIESSRRRPMTRAADALTRLAKLLATN
jgi:hypothetical protein